MSSSHVHSGDGRRYKSIFYSGDNDNSSADRDKNILMIRDNVWGKYKI